MIYLLHIKLDFVALYALCVFIHKKYVIGFCVVSTNYMLIVLLFVKEVVVVIKMRALRRKFCNYIFICTTKYPKIPVRIISYTATDGSV